MIRDPSDGSVRNVDNDHGAKSAVTTGDPRPSCRLCGLEDGACVCAHLRPTCKESLQVASGLPLESQKPERQAKLEKSREWLKHYHGTGE